MKNVSQTVIYYAYDTSANAYKTGDSANHTLRGMQDTTEFTPAASPSEIDSTNLKGAYKVSIAATENIGNLMLLGGVSSTANVILIPARWSNDPIPGVVRSGVAAGGGASTITLDANASATNSIYNGCRVAIVAGTGVGQGDRIITGYVGSTQVATVDTAWTTNPDNTSVFAIIPAAADLRTILATLSKGAAGAVAPDQAQIQNPTSTVDLSGTTIKNVDNAIATVTNLTNAPTAGDFTAAMKTSLNAATPASVVGAVGSVVGLTASNLDATVSSRATPAQVATQVDTVINVNTKAELGAVPAANASIGDKLAFIEMKIRNAETQTATQATIANSAGTPIGTATVSDDGTTFTKGKYA